MMFIGFVLTLLFSIYYESYCLGQWTFSPCKTPKILYKEGITYNLKHNGNTIGGVSLEVTCKKGYVPENVTQVHVCVPSQINSQKIVIQTNQEHGWYPSITLNCDKPCSLPKFADTNIEIANLPIDIHHKYLIGEFLHLQCQETRQPPSMILSGKSKIKCQSTGKWSYGKIEPYCKPIDCGLHPGQIKAKCVKVKQIRKRYVFIECLSDSGLLINHKNKILIRNTGIAICKYKRGRLNWDYPDMTCICVKNDRNNYSEEKDNQSTNSNILTSTAKSYGNSYRLANLSVFVILLMKYLYVC